MMLRLYLFIQFVQTSMPDEKLAHKTSKNLTELFGFPLIAVESISEMKFIDQNSPTDIQQHWITSPKTEIEENWSIQDPLELTSKRDPENRL